MPENEKQNLGRVAVLGANGFVGSELVRRLEELGVDVDKITRADFDLSASSIVPALVKRFSDASSIVFAAAVTPDVARKTGEDPTSQNMAAASSLAECAAVLAGTQLVYLSSDAVYGLKTAVFNEDSPVDPDDAYGRMHLAREKMMLDAWGSRAAILRLSQVYGAEDTHNAYGPCRFARQAAAGEVMEVFGRGEDGRDHIWIGDVTSAIVRVIEVSFSGVLCVSSGTSPTFRNIADMIVDQLPSARVEYLPRRVPAVLKRFDNTKLRELGVVPVPLEAGLQTLFPGSR